MRAFVPPEPASVSIVIPTLNESGYITRVLNSIANQVSDAPVEVVVADGGSTDDTIQEVRAFVRRHPDVPTEYVVTRADVGHQRNLGAAHSSNARLLFLDADVVLPAGFLKALTRLPNAPFVCAFRHVATDLSVGDRAFLMVIYGLMLITWWLRSPATNGDCILIDRAHHERISGFAEATLLGEDTDYGLRAVRLGATYRLFWFPTVIGSRRRINDEGRMRMLYLWCRVFILVRFRGPLYDDGSGLLYPFGHYVGVDDGPRRSGGRPSAVTILRRVTSVVARVDRSLHEILLDRDVPRVDRLVTHVSRAADRQQLTIGTVAILVGSLGRRGASIAASGLLAAGLGGAVAHVTKRVAKRRRPFEGFEVQRRTGVAAGAGTSFPSAHTASSVAFAATVARQVPRYGSAVRAVATAICYTRLHLGSHYPGDVLGGALLGTGVARAISRRKLRASDG